MIYTLYTAGEGKTVKLLEDWDRNGTKYNKGDWLKVDSNFADFLVDILKIAEEIKE